MNLVETSQALGVTQPTLTGWLRAGLVKPPDYQGRRRTPVKVGAKELREFTVIRDLRRAGVSLQNIRKAARFLRSLGANPFSTGRFLVVDRGEVVRITDEEGAIALIREPGQQILVPVLPLDEQITRNDEADAKPRKDSQQANADRA